MTDAPAQAADESAPPVKFWPRGWWRWMEHRIGVVPMPIFLLLAAVLGTMLAQGGLTNEINVWIAVLAVLGFACAELGKRIPVLRNIGGAITVTLALIAMARFG